MNSNSLKEYDLRPGHYQLKASGKAGVRWKYYPVYVPNAPPAPPPKHKETDPVPGAQFTRTLSLNIVASTARELRATFAPLVSDADATDPVQRQHARAAIIESAPAFLDSLIARFAAEHQDDSSPIDALSRIASPGSRTHLKSLLRTYRPARRSAIVLALARVGHRDDLDFLARVLQDETMDATSRRYAALGLGHIGGDKAAQSLGRALATAPPEMRPSLATALGNTRSHAAVPVLISMFGNNEARSEVCGALRTLTHRAWCDGAAGDPAATRRRWLRWWDENRAKTPIFGTDNCPVDPVAPAVVQRPAPAAERSPTSSPRISSVAHTVAAPNSAVTISGYALGLEDSDSVQVLFIRGAVERRARIRGSGRTLSADPDNEFQYAAVFVPAGLTPGRWEVVIKARDRRSAPVPLEIRTSLTWN